MEFIFTVYNLCRAITIFGVDELIKRLNKSFSNFFTGIWLKIKRFKHFKKFSIFQVIYKIWIKALSNRPKIVYNPFITEKFRTDCRYPQFSTPKSTPKLDAFTIKFTFLVNYR